MSPTRACGLLAFLLHPRHNDAGQVVGKSDGIGAFLWDNGEVTSLGTLNVRAINASGQVVGRSNHAFIWTNGQMKDLGTLVGPWGESQAWGVNGNGQVVGDSWWGGAGEHAALWSSGHVTDLNTLIDPALGWELTTARGIND
jgi:probable HAF family extracellular repeat protein